MFEIRATSLRWRLLAGLLLGLTQTVRGAHYPSHTLWTAWICWTTGWLTYRWTAGKPAPHH